MECYSFKVVGLFFFVCVCVVCFDGGDTKYTLKEIYHSNQF